MHKPTFILLLVALLTACRSGSKKNADISDTPKLVEKKSISNTNGLDTLKVYKTAPGEELLYQEPGVFATFTDSKRRGAGVISFQLDVNDGLRIYNEDGTLFGQIVLNEDLSYYTMDMPEKTVARKLIPEYDVAAFDFDAEAVKSSDKYLRIHVNGAWRKVEKAGIKYIFRTWEEYLRDEKDNTEVRENQ